MATVRILLGLFWLAIIGSGWSADRYIIENSYTYKDKNSRGLISHEHGREKVVAVAQSQIGVLESSENSSPKVDAYNAYVGLKKVAWCASFVSWCFGQAGYPQPRTAWSPSLFPANRMIHNPLRGMILGIYFPGLKRIAHCGIVENVKNDWVHSIEGNTNVSGSREGDGVYRRLRHKRSIYRYADWLNYQKN